MLGQRIGASTVWKILKDAGITANPTAAWTVQAARDLFLAHCEKLANTYIDHYNGRRPHRALQQQPPSPPVTPDTALPPPTASITRLPRCDGLTNEYENAA